jgi:hypothetical protein
MPRTTLDLNKTEDLKQVKGEWRVGPGLVPGEPNEGLKAPKHAGAPLGLQ